MMKIFRFISTLFLVQLLILFSGCEHKPAALELSKEEVDLGKVMISDEPRVIEIELRNSGDDELSITKVVPSCDCTSVDFPQEPIKGGHTAMLRVTFSAHDLFPGDIERDVEIFTNIESVPKVFRFKAQVRSANVLSDSCRTSIVYSHF